MAVGLMQHILSPLTFMTLLAAIVLNVAVLVMCNFLDLRGGGSLGLFSYSPVGGTGKCIKYGADVNDAEVRAARAGSFLAMIFGSIAFLMLLTRRFCFTIPCEQFLLSLLFLGAQICASLTWLVYHNNLCEMSGCEWGKAATVNIIAQVMYLVAAIMSSCVPDRKAFRGEPQD